MEKFLEIIVWLGQHKLITTLLVLGILVGFGFRRDIIKKIKGGGSDVLGT